MEVFLGRSLTDKGLAFLRAAAMVLALLAAGAAPSHATTLGTLSAVTIPTAVLTGTRAQADAAVLGPQSFTITTDNIFTTTARIDIGIDVSGAQFSATTTPAISGLTCQGTTLVQTSLMFTSCAVTTQGTVAFQVTNVSYTMAGDLAAPGTKISLSGAIYNSSNTRQIFETLPTATAVLSTAVSYTLTVTSGGAGTGAVAVSPQQASYAYGSTVTLTANAAGGSALSAWGGACSATAATNTSCTVTITGNTTVSATFVRASTYTLTTKTASTGTVTATGTIAVNPIASAYTAGTVVTLTANPGTGAALSSWSGGGCTGSATTCQVTMSANQTVTATFVSTLSYNLTVSTSGTGTGTLSASPFATAYAPGTVVTLTAHADSGSAFTGWNGACSGTASTCSVTMSANRAVGGTFVIVPSYSLTVSSNGTGTGTITASPSPSPYVQGTAVTLTATASAGSTFTGWSGDCSGTAATCALTMNAAKTVAGSFARNITGVLRQAGVFSTAASTAQSFLRFYNASGAAGTVTVTLSDYASGVSLGSWTSPSIAPGTAPQYAIATIEGALPAFTAKPTLYSVTMQAQFNGTFQHVLWKPGDGTLSNLSTCDSGTAPILTRVTNVHGSGLGAAGYPSSIVVYNTNTTSAASVQLNVADAATGASLGTYTSASIPANGQQVLQISTLENAIGITSAQARGHYIITIQNLFTGYLQHLLTNSQVGVVTDMSTVCSFPAITASVPTNPSGV